MKAYERFLQYVKFDTQSDPESTTYPSTIKQLDLAKYLLQELFSFGVYAELDEFGYVIGKIPSNSIKKLPKIALIAHMDTSHDSSGKNIHPRIIKNYDGKKIILNNETQLSLDPVTFPNLLGNIGHDLIVTDGTTLLGADDKAGIAEIMTLVEYLTSNPKFEHGELRIVFTPDEEVGRGTDHLDLTKVDADFGYTLDGSKVGEIAFENFNAASAKLVFNGKSVHPGSAKNKMLNAIHLAYEFNQLLPEFMRPEITEGYEGFNHMTSIEGSCEQAKSNYIIRNHDRTIFAQQKRDFESAASFINEKYGKGTCHLTITDSYFNMRDILESKMEIIDIAKQAITNQGIIPVIEPIRGGTDGARLTYLGLPCPNLGTGGYNFHGPFEYLSINEMDSAVEIIKGIIEIVTK
jgi:tripeptide aminopeptidase